MATAARMPMIATTIINSIRVKPLCTRIEVAFILVIGGKRRGGLERPPRLVGTALSAGRRTVFQSESAARAAPLLRIRGRQNQGQRGDGAVDGRVLHARLD